MYFIINYLKDYVIWHWTFKGRHLLIFPLLGGTSLKPHLHWDKFMCAFNFSWSTQSECLFVHQFIYSTVSWRKTIILSLGYLGVLSWWSKCVKLFSDLSLCPSCFRMFLHIYTYCFFLCSSFSGEPSNCFTSIFLWTLLVSLWEYITKESFSQCLPVCWKPFWGILRLIGLCSCIFEELFHLIL